MVVGPTGLGIDRLGNLFDNGQQVIRSLDRSDAKRGPGPYRGPAPVAFSHQTALLARLTRPTVHDGK